jgi:uncharacterized cupin superfamily protein
VAHQTINTSRTELRSLAVSNNEPVKVCDYPDSGKVGVFTSAAGARLRELIRVEIDVDCYDRENLQPPP